MTTDLVPTIDFSPAKAHLSDVVTGVFHQHQPILVSRHHGKEQVILVRVDDLLAMLPSDPFDVEVVYDPSSVAVAVSDLGLMGVGDTLDLAIDDLLVEMRSYVRRFFADPLRYFAAGQGARAGRLLAFALASDDAQRRILLVADEPSAEVGQDLHFA